MIFLKNVSAVFFDWDGTLVDTAASSFRVINQFLVSSGKPTVTEDTYMASPSLSVRDAFQSIFDVHEYGSAVRDFRKFLETHHPSPTPFRASELLLSLLHRSRVPMGIVSNQYGDVLRHQVHALGWESYFCKIIGSGDVEYDKPSPVPLLHALKNSDLTPHESVLFVGDSTVDMICAERAGCTPVSVGTQAEKFEGSFISLKNIQNFYDTIRKCISAELN